MIAALVFALVFAWPYALAALLLLPVLVFTYVALVKRQAKRAADLAASGFAPSASTTKRRKRRHIPYLFFLFGIAALLVSVGRPQTTISVPNRSGTVVLAFDVSNSMRADDLKPTRMDAAKVAAKEFIKNQPASIKVGVVAFGDGAIVTQQPTNDKTLVTAAIDRLKAQGGTSIGQGIFASLSAIAGKPIRIDPEKVNSGAEEIDIGYFGSGAVVLLSDGENTSDFKPEAFAKLASVAGVKVHTVGIGKPEGSTLKIDGFQVATALNEELLQAVAKTTDGSYFAAADEQQLKKIYSTIDLAWKREPKKSEVTGVLAAIGAGLLALGSLLSLLWFGRIV